MAAIAPFSGGPSSTVAIGGGISGTSSGGGAASPLDQLNAHTLGAPNDGTAAGGVINGIITNLIAGKKTTLYFPSGVYGLEVDVNFPRNVDVVMAEGARFTAVNAGRTLTLTGELDAHLDLLFDQSVNAFTVLFARAQDARPEWWGAKGDGKEIADAAMTATFTNLTSPSNPFVAADVGKVVYVRGAAAGGAGLTTTIAAFVNAGTVTLAVAASTTVAGQMAVWGTDDCLPIQRMLAAMSANGGDLWFEPTPKGIYVVKQVFTRTLRIPGIGASFTAGDEVDQYHWFLQNVDAIHFRGYGSTIMSLEPFGGHMLILDGHRDFDIDGVTFRSIASFNGVTGAVLTSGMNAVAMTSTTRDSERIRFTDLHGVDVYTLIYTFGDPASAFKVRGIHMLNLLGEGGNYLVACHENGDMVDFGNVRSKGANARAYFVYGVDNHRGSIQVDAGFAGFSPFLIKAYGSGRDCTNINVRLRCNRSNNGGVPKLLIQAQHDPVAQVTPRIVRNSRIEFSDIGTTGPSINFDYFQNAVQTAVSSFKLFDNIVLAGHCVNPITTTVIQGNGVRGYLSIRDMVEAGVSNILQGQGFYQTAMGTWAPVLKFGGAAPVGITYSFQQGEFYIEGNICHCYARIILTAKGAQAGQASVSLPIPSAPYSNLIAVVHGKAANMAALTSPPTGWTANNGSVANLEMQGAASVAPITDANFTNTTDLLLEFSYAI